MNRFLYYENKRNNITVLQRNTPVPFYHIWRVYNLEALRYLTKTNIELPNYIKLYTHVCKFLDHLQTHYEIENWAISIKKEQIHTKTPLFKFNSKKLRVTKNFVFKIYNTNNTNTTYKIFAFQKQISINNTPVSITKRFNTDNNLTYINLNSKKVHKLQTNNEKI